MRASHIVYHPNTTNKSIPTNEHSLRHDMNDFIHIFSIFVYGRFTASISKQIASTILP